MPTPKSKKSSPWIECDSCGIIFLNKDVDKHYKDCRQSVENISYFHIRSQVLFGDLDVKKNEEVIGLSINETDDLVFLSQSAMQLMDVAIGDWVVIKSNNCLFIVKKIWPTMEKSLTSVLLTRNVLDLYLGDLKTYPNVYVSKLMQPLNQARKIHVMLVGNSKLKILEQDLLNRLKNSYKGKVLIEENNLVLFYFGKMLKFIVKVIENDVKDLECTFAKLTISEKLAFEVTESTQWILYNDEDQFRKQLINQCPFSRIGGLSEEINEIKHIMEVALGMNATLQQTKYTKSVLLYGNSGTGKTILASAVAKYSQVYSVPINASDLYTKYTTSPEETVRALFEDAVENAPSVIVLDEIDLLCPIRSSRLSENEKRIVSVLLVLLDKLNINLEAKVFIIATTNKIDNVDPCFRRHGRLDREMEIPTPNPRSREDILDKLLTNISHNLSRAELKEVSMKTHGYVGSDLEALCAGAAIHASQYKRNILQFVDFKFAMSRVRPSAMREVQIEVPNIKWNDIGGQENLKLILRQAVEWPLKYAASFVRLGITPPRGVLMYGPPGCSKTMIAKALATESGLNFLSIKGPELFSKWVGESERAVREVFRKARQVAPSIIFFDEIDALGGERSSGTSASVQERVLAQLLTELDGVTPLGDVTILAATNRPDKIDKALLRPGRLDRIVYVPLPDPDTRREIFKLKLTKMPVENADIEMLVSKTENYSGAEVNAVCHEAAMKALEENIDAESVKMEHFEKALQMITPRTPTSLICLYEEYSFKNI